MHRLIWVFAWRTFHFVGFVMRRLMYYIWISQCNMVANTVPINLFHKKAFPLTMNNKDTVTILCFRTKHVWAKREDPDKTRSSLIRVYTVCHSACFFWKHYCMLKPHCSNFWTITTIFSDVQFFWFLWYFVELKVSIPSWHHWSKLWISAIGFSTSLRQSWN